MTLWKFPTDAILSVKHFTAALKEILEQQIPPCWIRGEVSNLKQQSSGHFYFTLKDSESQVSAVLFKGDALRQSTQLTEGKELLIYGEIQVYEPRGAYQVIVRCVLPVGDGKLRAEFERNKALLQAEGLFDVERKKSLPFYPRKIALITSSTGAVLHDFHQILLRGGWKGTLFVLPASVQGINAMSEIIEQLKVAANLDDCDAVVIARGGGSLEDLWVFNEPILVRAVSACPKPTISAIGHETDTTLTDYAADFRAETPSAAAHWVLKAFHKVLERKETVALQFKHQFFSQLEKKQNVYLHMKRYWELLSPQKRLEAKMLRLSDLENRLEYGLERTLSLKKERLAKVKKAWSLESGELRIQRKKAELKDLAHRLEDSFFLQLTLLKERLTLAKTILQNNRLENILRKGFAYVKSEHGEFVSTTDKIQSGELAEVVFYDGNHKVKVL